MLKEVADALEAGKRWSSESPRSEPGDEAPAKALIEYWRSRSRDAFAPSDQSRWRLLNAVLKEHRFHASVLDLLPDTTQATALVKHFLDQFDDGGNQRQPFYSKESRDALRNWLSRHSNYDRDLLLTHAKEVDEEDEAQVNFPDLEALARLDWQSAEPIIEQFSKSLAANVAAYALTLLYDHARASDGPECDTLQEQLKQLVTGKSSSDAVREIAIDALMQDYWPGRDVWFLSLFGDSLPSQTEDGNELDFLVGPIQSEPDRWIPILTELIKDKNPSTHNAAVYCLAQFTLNRARADALRPLLPWLSNPQWANANKYARARFIDSMGLVPMPEAIPGLLAIVQNERESPRSRAAMVLGKLRDRRAIPVLRRAIEKAGAEDDYLDYLIVALMDCEPLSEAEKLKAIEAIADESHFSEMAYSRRRLATHYPKSLRGAIGKVVIQQEAVSDSIATAVVKRSKGLQRSNPSLADRLWHIALKYNLPSVDKRIAEQIVEEQVDLETLLIGLERRKRLQAIATPILKPAISLGGYAAGVSAAVLSDINAQLSILTGRDSEATIALLSCARILREDLPTSLVSSLLAVPNSRLRLAALRFLESVDSQESRTIVRAQRPGELVIHGARGVFDPKERYREQWVKWENALLDDVLKNRVDEVFAELKFYYSDTFRSQHSVEIRVKDNEGELCKRQDSAREECRPLEHSELAAAREMFAEGSFDQLTPIPVPAPPLGSTERQFVRINKNGGRRVYAADLSRLQDLVAWPLQQQTPQERLEEFLDDMANTGAFELRYAARKAIKGLEVLAADDNRPVKFVCAEGGELRVLVEDQEVWKAIRRGQKDDSLNWHVLEDGKIGAVTGQPRACEVLDDYEDLPNPEERFRMNRENPLWQIKVGDGLVRIVDYGEKEGIWLCGKGQKPKLVAAGSYFHPIVSADGNWLVVVKRLNRIEGIARIDLRTNQELAAESDDGGFPMFRVPGSPKLLLGRYKGSDHLRALLDPATGTVEPARGEFEPIEHQHFRPLQPIRGSREYWAAIPDFESNSTRIGRYDTLAFKFTSMLELPGIAFSSERIWVDEPAGWLYIAYNGHLLRLPFSTLPQ